MYIVQHQYFSFYILLICGVRTHPTHPHCLRAWSNWSELVGSTVVAQDCRSYRFRTEMTSCLSNERRDVCATVK